MKNKEEIVEKLKQLSDKDLILVKSLMLEGREIIQKYKNKNSTCLTEKDLEKLISNKIIIDRLLNNNRK